MAGGYEEAAPSKLSDSEHYANRSLPDRKESDGDLTYREHALSNSADRKNATRMLILWAAERLKAVVIVLKEHEIGCKNYDDCRSDHV